MRQIETLANTHLPCAICGKPVALEVAKLDEHGQAPVHEDCYVAKVGKKATESKKST